MKRVPLWVWFLLGIVLWTGVTLGAPRTASQPWTWLPPSAVADASTPELQPFDTVVKDTETSPGLFTLYRHPETGNVYLEIKPNQLEKNFLATVTLESGIGERGLYSGLPLQDLLFYFHRVNNNLQFVVRNVNFRTEPGDPQTRSLARSFSDSVLSSLTIQSIHPTRKTLLVDLSDLLLADLPGLTPWLSSLLEGDYQLDASRSYFGTANAFPANVEIESIYGFSTDKGSEVDLPTLPDSRALTLRIRYSLSQMPENRGYHPRLADERIGYFFTTYQTVSNPDRGDPFVRYINRWHLEKQDPKAPLSPPKQPIVFWIENAVPVIYREAIREGVLLWNKAFEQAGFQNAIQVQQMPDQADWDPADVRYNTIRWFNSLDGFFARGPIRVNTLTGEILDADIMVDAGVVRSVQQDYRRLVEQSQPPSSLLSALIGSHQLCQSGMSRQSPSQGMSSLERLVRQNDLCYGLDAARQLTIGQMGLSLLHDALPTREATENYVAQYLRWLIAHEVGHTLGLRHNFHGSTLLKPQELNEPELTQTKGLVSSVMDYLPTNLAPQGTVQGDYFPNVIGAYDLWAIEYGYKESDALVPQAEKRFLEEIAKRSVNPELAYATDEDIVDLNPDASAWDLSNDVLSYSQIQLDNARAMWARLEKRYPLGGESYRELSERFDMVFWHYFQNLYLITKYIGGQSFSRSHAGVANGRLPFESVPVADQRAALGVLQNYLFADGAFNFSPHLLNQLAPSRWLDWGNDAQVERLDYPIHDSIFFLQSLVLRDLLSSDRLSRLRDIELKSEPNQALTLPELFETLTQSIWTEVLQPNDSLLNISSVRRSLQRDHLNILMAMVLRTAKVPEDARTLAWYQLHQLQGTLNSALRKQGDELDTYTSAHLLETGDRIKKALDAQIQSR